MKYACYMGGVLALALACWAFGRTTDAKEVAAFVHDNISARLPSPSTADFQYDADRVIDEGEGVMTLSSHLTTTDKSGKVAQLTFSATCVRHQTEGRWMMALLILDGQSVETEITRSLLRRLRETKGNRRR